MKGNSKTGQVTIHFTEGHPVTFHGTVSTWPRDIRPLVSATPPVRLMKIDWDRVNAILVVEDTTDDS